MSKETKSSQPKEAQVMASILREMGISEYEPGVVHQMLEFTYRYVTQVLDDARVYSNYAKRPKSIETDDVKLAIHMMVEKSFTSPPPRDLLLELSRTRNSYPLPSIKPQSGIRLPPDRYCLSSCNMRLKSSHKKGGMSQSGNSRVNGPARGIKVENNPLKPSISMVTTKTGNTPTFTLVQKPSTAVNAAPTQKIVSVNRPLIKVSSGLSGGVGDKMEVNSNNTDSLGELNMSGIKTENDISGLKRAREDDDYDT